MLADRLNIGIRNTQSVAPAYPEKLRGLRRLPSADLRSAARPHLARSQVENAGLVAELSHLQQSAATSEFHVVRMGRNGQEIEVQGVASRWREGGFYTGLREGPKFWELAAPCVDGRRGTFCADKPHSVRRATMGSTRMARRAGKKQARAAIAARRRVTAPRLSGSKGLTRKRRLLIRRVSISEPTKPAARPRTTSFIPWEMISARTFWGWAPSAIRTPISCVRRLTAKARR